MSSFIRLRRARMELWSRSLVSETALTVNDFVLPIFLNDDNVHPKNIKGLPGITRKRNEDLEEYLAPLVKKGLKAVILFSTTNPVKRSEMAEESYNPDNAICKAIREIKSKFGSTLGVMSDVALDCYTTHSHDGIIINNKVDNDITVNTLVKQAIVHAEAGTDVIAPSDMMDGRVLFIREALDKNGFSSKMILAYSAKYASYFYKPFREAVNSKYLSEEQGFILKKTYHMDPTNTDEAVREAEEDIHEGADFILVKPALAYLDIIYRLKHLHLPIFAYHTSGEYALAYKLAEGDEQYLMNLLQENFICIKRAGAKVIISYAAEKMISHLNK